ncbi:SIR2 family NAD-dependent protein deacylase [Aeoliella mucimassa]|uniref:protein acetyllysine N-acetyltransferase n=1 Tax=Aeoliella mucimassa TaxID=2527972 RepID=A0A518AJ71_9BACT|nr:NAD-dependent deacylase [Aeoliella mucimassa]QDU54787.1 NAD-dependent protein deacetylase [Aeoliella mucimassa]
MDNAIATQVAEWLAEAEHAVVFTGAGMSTESGIPDFRSPGGIWTRFRTVYYDEFMASPDARREYWHQKAMGHREFADSQPNAGHLVIAKWESAGNIRGVITQNIDGLHQIAGNQQVLELHGTARQIECQDCGARFDAEPLVAQYLETDEAPKCTECPKGRLKHATVSFGQSLPTAVLSKAASWSQEADLMLAIGSSLVVNPAAELPVIAKRSGSRLVIINRDPTPLDTMADLVIPGSIGEVLTAIDQAG